ncbi:hypothetical protein L596_026904 [Steinernema carpocapsae]|uniref:Protein kinase domain-containing protein n=1 Tax=Steinernema carpocapsae TaxID=34508 RepID=A0A4U5M2T3_STECR|nr:hypothetical protein L596_026904 [Steinernema carpocapsae]
MAPESYAPPCSSLPVHTNNYGSDLWGYGVTIWEVYNNGRHPYEGKNELEVMDFVKGGGRLEKTGFGKDDAEAWQLCQRIWKREKTSVGDAQNTGHDKTAAKKHLEEGLGKRAIRRSYP